MPRARRLRPNAMLSMLDPAQLRQRVAERFRVSGASGSRIPLRSRQEIVEDHGVRCVVRVLTGRGRRANAAGNAGGSAGPPSIRPLSPLAACARPGAAGEGASDGMSAASSVEPRTSPFLPPYDPTLLVGDISPGHVCLLNKYNVFDHHLLIVTRDFEDQQSPLGAGDLRAARTCLAGLGGLLFYNAGAAAGASQPHMHLQLVPLPIGPGAERFPLDRAIGAALAAGVDRVPELRLRHRLVALPRHDDGEQAHRVYRDLLTSFELEREDGRSTAPYNLLMTLDWMLVVPRAGSACGSLDVNALGFAGALLARGEGDLALVRELGPLEVLRRVAFPV